MNTGLSRITLGAVMALATAKLLLINAAAASPLPEAHEASPAGTTTSPTTEDDDRHRPAGGAATDSRDRANRASVESSPEGRLATETIRKVVHSRGKAFKACYDAGLERDSKLTGNVVAKFVIDADGATTNLEDDHSTLPDASVVDCVLEQFRTLTYPKPEGGVVTVVYPLLLTPPAPGAYDAGACPGE